ncbi:MAG: hypothetical protein ACRD3Q_20170 [Terriglobales bacterium]
MIEQNRKLLFFALVACACSVLPAAAGEKEIELNGARVLVGASEPSYVQYAAQDLAHYLNGVTGENLPVSRTVEAAGQTTTVIAVGEEVADALQVRLPEKELLGVEGSSIRAIARGGLKIIVVAGRDPHGTNMGVATLLRLIGTRGRDAYLPTELDLTSKPSIAVRGFHMNGGWQLNHPYGFRTWTEEDWKRFVDIVWAERGNLIFIWPYAETMTIPLAREDQEYLEEFRRITEYAQKQRGMEVWIMQSANRVAISNCHEPDPRLRPHWLDGCQKDMNPADPDQFANIVRSFETLYRAVTNANAFCLIDSDPGGWPQSPISEQVKIFRAARGLLDRYNVHGRNTKLVDWMWIGWGRHKYFSAADHLITGFDWSAKNPDESDVAFMEETIRAFKNGLPEPWELIAGMAAYLKAAKQESVLAKTIFLPYGEIEMEPAFPATNMGFDSLRKVLQLRTQYPGLQGWMGNNELMLLQFPRSFYFMSSLWDSGFAAQSEGDVVQELSRLLDPDHAQEVSAAFLALEQKDPGAIRAALDGVSPLADSAKAVNSGVIGRFLFGPTGMFMRDLQMQLEIRLARQSLIAALHGHPQATQCAELLEDYFDKILAWNQKTGWYKTIEIGIWNTPLYEDGADLAEIRSRMKQLLGGGSPHTSYAQIDSFFAPITRRLQQKYDYDSVMLGCVEPFKLAIAQSQ